MHSFPSMAASSYLIIFCSYEPHEKLQNFMVPIPVRGGWHEEQIDELFASLLGKGFEGDMSAPATNDLEATQKESEVMQGFRVFG